MSKTASKVTFRFCHPAGASKKPPSPAMTEALQRLSEAEEMQSLVANAKAQNRTVTLEVFHSRDGRPLLIYPVVQEKAETSV
jgi:hypothetical protein